MVHTVWFLVLDFALKFVNIQLFFSEFYLFSQVVKDVAKVFSIKVSFKGLLKKFKRRKCCYCMEKLSFVLITEFLYRAYVSAFHW